MSRDHNAGGSHNLKNDNSFFERMKGLKYVGTNLMKQNSIQEEITSRLKSGNAAIFRCRTLCLPVCYPEI
jgi:hypothetical protein